MRTKLIKVRPFLTEAPGTVPLSQGLQGAAAGARITIGPLTDQDGFPLMVSAFERNTAGVTMLPVIETFTAAPPAPERHGSG